MIHPTGKRGNTTHRQPIRPGKDYNSPHHDKPVSIYISFKNVTFNSPVEYFNHLQSPAYKSNIRCGLPPPMSKIIAHSDKLYTTQFYECFWEELSCHVYEGSSSLGSEHTKYDTKMFCSMSLIMTKFHMNKVIRKQKYCILLFSNQTRTQYQNESIEIMQHFKISSSI